MTAHSGGGARVVLGLDVLARAAFDPECLRVLACWREGLVRPVLHAPLLRRTVTLLTRLGLGEEVVRGWVAWLTHPETGCFLAGEADDAPEAPEAPRPLAELYAEAAARARALGGAVTVITRLAPPTGAETPAGGAVETPADAPRWLTPEAFLANHDFGKE